MELTPTHVRHLNELGSLEKMAATLKVEDIDVKLEEGHKYPIRRRGGNHRSILLNYYSSTPGYYSVFYGSIKVVKKRVADLRSL